MNSAIKVESPSELRRFIRMDTVFPVELAFKEGDDSHLGPITQGFSRNISKGGLCIEYLGSDAVYRNMLNSQEATRLRLDMQISVPFKPYVVSAGGKVAWVERSGSGKSAASRYQIGVEYEWINPKHASVIVGFARKRKLFPFLVGMMIAAASVTITGLLFYQNELIEQNRHLVNSVVEQAQRRSGWVSDLDAASSEERRLKLDLKHVLFEMKRIDGMIESLPPDDQRLTELEYKRDEWVEQEAILRNQLNLVHETVQLADRKLKDERDLISSEHSRIINQLYAWLDRHAIKGTGLIPSFEGDQNLNYIGYTYDQALLIMSHTIMGNHEKAAQVLSVFRDRARKVDGAYVSAYDASSVEPVEWNVHVGPNVWIGLAALQYQRRTNDRQFEAMAVELGNWLIRLQNEDPEKGLRGGPKFTWFSTEHNLDAYAFYKMLDEITGDTRFDQAAEQVFDWIMKNAADRQSNRFNRGKGDATIATDTFSWSIAAIGPERLNAVEMDPEGIMEFAEEHCRVTVLFDRPEGKTVEITGFDFSKPENLPRGGIVSSEWTAQAVVTFQVLEDYFKRLGISEKAGYYRRKAAFYLTELQKMIISSISKTGQGRGCLPYATAAQAQTGHGWKTPNGNRTGSVAGTAYSLFAWKRFNPFM